MGGSACIGDLPIALLEGGGGPLFACRSEDEVSIVAPFWRAVLGGEEDVVSSSDGGDEGRVRGTVSEDGVWGLSSAGVLGDGACVT